MSPEALFAAQLAADLAGEGSVVRGLEGDTHLDETETRSGFPEDDATNGRKPASRSAKEQDGADEDAKADDDDDDTTTDETDAGEEEPGDETDAEEEEESEETDADEEQDADEDDEDAKIPGFEDLPKGVQKRFTKLLGERRELRAQLAAVQAEPIRIESADEPLLAVGTLEALDKKLAQAKAVKEWALKNRDGWSGEIEGEPTTFTAEEMAAKLEAALGIIEAAPTRRDYLTKRAEIGSRAAAERLYPDMFRKGTTDHTVYEHVLKTVPELVRLPDYEMFVGHWLRGFRQAMEEAKGEAVYKRIAIKKTSSPPDKAKASASAVKPGAKPKPPAPSAAKPAAKPASSATAPKAAEVIARAVKSGSEEDARAAAAAEALGF